jgi:hypothetical protein
MPDFSTLLLIGLGVSVVITAVGEEVVNRITDAKKPSEGATSNGKQNQ